MPNAKSTQLGLAGLAMLAGSLVMLWFVILAAVTTTSPLSRTYFLRADTNGITGARAISQWTYFYACGLDNSDCDSAHAAPPFGFVWASNAANVPPGLGGSHGTGTTSYKFFYLWRFGWVFLILTLFFEVLAFFSGFLACCGRLGSAVALCVASIALLCYSVAVSLTTATFVLARNKFHAVGRDANIGSYAFGFLWASFVCLLIATVLFGLGMTSGDKGSRRLWRSRSVRSARSNRSRSYDGRRVKEEYS